MDTRSYISLTEVANPNSKQRISDTVASDQVRSAPVDCPVASNPVNSAVDSGPAGDIVNCDPVASNPVDNIVDNGPAGSDKVNYDPVASNPVNSSPAGSGIVDWPSRQ